MKTIRFSLPVIFVVLFSCSAFGQVKPAITARIDTTRSEVKAVYQLIGNYFNSSPDSVYQNPYWNEQEVNYYYKQQNGNFDLAAHFLFAHMNAKQLFSTFKPTVLSIEPAGEKYVARILLAADTVQQWMVDYKMNPPFLLRYYAARDKTGTWKLENTWSNELSRWGNYKTKWVTFYYPPTFNFSAANAEKASRFVEDVVARMELKEARPFDFYVMSSEEELGRLHNLDYWLSYSTGFTQKLYNRALSAKGREEHLHEFVHMVYPLLQNHFLAEGVATWLGGVDGYTPFQETLHAVSKDIYENHPNVTFHDLYSNKFRYATEQSPRYVAGAVVYQLVYEERGLQGIRQFEKSQNTYESLIKTFASVMKMKESKVEGFLTNYIRQYHLTGGAKS
ncbi:hypothetical protein [Pontibacter burrus]|uniref:DUF4932 domain-containing protein n=1 Tax=Pontibacter burrus TaxID=2704466 RepID=A0A6B3LTM0_9BACT|nr:hypothetical protein [Pontibacter burrus]NEM96917.1 hypothetical protein [Pontibacter burrus]